MYAWEMILSIWSLVWKLLLLFIFGSNTFQTKRRSKLGLSTSTNDLIESEISQDENLDLKSGSLSSRESLFYFST